MAKQGAKSTKTSVRGVPALAARNAKAARKFDAFPDRIDPRDWAYQPTLAPLPDELVNCHRVPEVLDQKREGACTGFALAGVINFLLASRGSKRRVSPRMLYEMARCYDEWPGENYEGSSARGAMKGWQRHGVCASDKWPDDSKGRGRLTDDIGRDGLRTPCGAYYRVKHKEIRDVHAAIAEVGAVYVTLGVHDGWQQPDGAPVTVRDGKGKRKLPVIRRLGRAAGGHAVALVGYTRDGFVVQNSWGEAWGADGFALLPYEDYLLHSTDVWVAQLGVPVAADLWTRQRGADTTAGLFRAKGSIPLADIRPYVVDIGNNGELSQSGNYWTSEDDLRRLFQETIPVEAKRRGWPTRRVMLYLHGGLNGERDVAKRIVAFRDVCLDNGIYPLHVMWETGPLETLSSLLEDLFSGADERAGGGFMDGMREMLDRLLEISAAPVGGRMWSEMKENAMRASDHRQKRGAMQLIARQVRATIEASGADAAGNWELHVVGHSAGSIFAVHALPHLTTLGVPFRTFQLLAPAIRIDEFKALALPAIEGGVCPRPTVYVLDAAREVDDTVGPYGKSLLWLVSNAFEDRRGTPLLGMLNALDGEAGLKSQLSQPIGGLPGLVVAGGARAQGAESDSTTHGGFDNDAATMNSVLRRILGAPPIRPFDKRDLAFE